MKKKKSLILKLPKSKKYSYSLHCNAENWIRRSTPLHDGIHKEEAKHKTMTTRPQEVTATGHLKILVVEKVLKKHETCFSTLDIFCLFV